MKRLWTAIIIVSLLIVAGLYTLYRLDQRPRNQTSVLPGEANYSEDNVINPADPNAVQQPPESIFHAIGNLLGTNPPPPNQNTNSQSQNPPPAGQNNQTNPPPAEPVGVFADVEIKQNQFTVAVVTISVGESVRWTNRDDKPHIVKSLTNAFESTKFGQNDIYTYKFEQAGTYEYQSELLPSMIGKIIVQ